MTVEQKLVLVKKMTDETDEAVISAFLDMAGEAIYNHVDPYGMSDSETVIEKYGGVQARAAAYWLNKRGWDGQTGHSENGVSRSYEAGDLPPSILRELTSICGVSG